MVARVRLPMYIWIEAAVPLRRARNANAATVPAGLWPTLGSTAVSPSRMSGKRGRRVRFTVASRTRPCSLERARRAFCGRRLAARPVADISLTAEPVLGELRIEPDAAAQVISRHSPHKIAKRRTGPSRIDSDLRHAIDARGGAPRRRRDVLPPGEEDARVRRPRTRIVPDPRGGEPCREARANYAAMFDTHIAVRLGSVAFRELSPGRRSASVDLEWAAVGPASVRARR